MKFGATESKTKTWIAIALAVVALLMTARMILGNFWSPETTAASNTPSVTTPPTPARRAPARRGRSAPKQASTGPVTPNLDPRLRLDLLKETETTEYTGEGRNIFRAQADDAIKIPAPVATPFKKPEPTQVVDQGPPPPPPPPPINLKFFGFASQQGGKKVFLSSGEDVFVAQEGDIVQRRYKIVKVNPTNIEVQDVLSNNRQTIPLTAG